MAKPLTRAELTAQAHGDQIVAFIAVCLSAYRNPGLANPGTKDVVPLAQDKGTGLSRRGNVGPYVSAILHLADGASLPSDPSLVPAAALQHRETSRYTNLLNNVRRKPAEGALAAEPVIETKTYQLAEQDYTRDYTERGLADPHVQLAELALVGVRRAYPGSIGTALDALLAFRLEALARQPAAAHASEQVAPGAPYAA